MKNCLPLNASFSTNSKTDAGRDLPVAAGVKVEGNSQMTYCSVHFPAIFILLNVIDGTNENACGFCTSPGQNISQYYLLYER